MRKVVVVGSVNVDIFLKVTRMPQVGETILGDKFYWYLGGKGANQAVGIARLGIPVYFVGKVGNDPFKQRIIDELKKERVNTRYVMEDGENPSGMAVIFVDNEGRNCITVIGGANRHLTCADIEKIKKIIEREDMVILQMEIPLETVKFTLEIARASGATTLLNPAPAHNLDGKDFHNIDILVPNEGETEKLSGVKINSLRDAGKAADLLLDKGVKIVVITMGEKGAFLATKKKTSHFPAVAVKPLDTTGAGDSFVAALTVALIQGKGLEEAVRYANYAASLSVTRAGAQPSLPHIKELEDFINRRVLGSEVD